MLKVLIFIAHLSMFFAQNIPVIYDGNNKKHLDHIPFVASLRFQEIDESYFGKGHFCTGAFISQKAVLTLASCFYQNDALLAPEEVRIVGGTKFQFEEEQNTFFSLLDSILIHDNFSRSSLENNIAIGYLATEIPKNNRNSAPVKEIAREAPLENQKLNIYGWSLSTAYEVSAQLLEGEVQIASLERCDSNYSKITTTTLCAGPYHVNGCETDDGGPLVDENQTLFGLIDVRPDGYCSRIITNRLGTYVDVSKFYDWISKHNSSSRLSLCSSLYFVLSVILFFNKA